VVDFPAPFGPRNPVTLPGCTTKLRSSTATLSHSVSSTPTYELPSGIIGRCRLPI
jgi:hypothetical protein